MVLEAYRRKPLLDIDNMISPDGAFRVIKLNGGGKIETTDDLKSEPLAYIIGPDRVDDTTTSIGNSTTSIGNTTAYSVSVQPMNEII